MSMKIQAFTIVGIIYVVFSAIYYEIVIQLVESKQPKL